MLLSLQSTRNDPLVIQITFGQYYNYCHMLYSYGTNNNNNTLLRYMLDCRLFSKQQHGLIRRKYVCTNLLECLEDWTLNLQSTMGCL